MQFLTHFLKHRLVEWISRSKNPPHQRALAKLNLQIIPLLVLKALSWSALKVLPLSDNINFGNPLLPNFKWIVLTQSEILFFQISFNFAFGEPSKVFEQRSWNNEIALALYYCWTIQIFICISKGRMYRVDACESVVRCYFNGV